MILILGCSCLSYVCKLLFIYIVICLLDCTFSYSVCGLRFTCIIYTPSTAHVMFAWFNFFHILFFSYGFSILIVFVSCLSVHWLRFSYCRYLITYIRWRSRMFSVLLLCFVWWVGEYRVILVLLTSRFYDNKPPIEDDWVFSYAVVCLSVLRRSMC